MKQGGSTSIIGKGGTTLISKSVINQDSFQFEALVAQGLEGAMIYSCPPIVVAG